jgi:hypothetical protein
MDMRVNDTPGDAPDDAPDDANGTWMTYDELAAARGIDRIAAVKLALRNAWRKQRDRYRVARVRVPLECAGSNLGKGPSEGACGGANSFCGTSAYPADDNEGQAPELRLKKSDQARAVERSMWRKLLAEERERADKAEQEGTRLLGVIDDFERRIAATEERADQADEAMAVARGRAGQPDPAFGACYTVAEQPNGCVAEERAGADLVQEALAAQRAGVDLVHKALAAQRARADEAGKAFAAERARANEAGKALVAERVRADKADEALAAERARADEAGKAMVAARVRAEEADEALAAERAHADKTREWIDELRGLFTTMPGRGE